MISQLSPETRDWVYSSLLNNFGLETTHNANRQLPNVSLQESQRSSHITHQARHLHYKGLFRCHILIFHFPQKKGTLSILVQVK